MQVCEVRSDEQKVKVSSCLLPLITIKQDLKTLSGIRVDKAMSK